MDLCPGPLRKAPLMHLSLVPPRQVVIGDAASFVGITSETIRSYHETGLLPASERGSTARADTDTNP